MTAQNINQNSNDARVQISHDYTSVLPTLASINNNTQQVLASIAGYTNIQLSQAAKAMSQSGDSTSSIISSASGLIGALAILAA